MVLVIRKMAIAFVFLAGVRRASSSPSSGALPTSFVPNEDQGYVMAAVIMPDAASLDRTAAVTERVDAIFAKTPGVADRTQLTGYSLLDGGLKTNAGTLFVTLKPYDERYGTVAKAKAENAKAVLMNVYAKGQEIKEGLVIPVAPPAIPGIGTTGGFEFWVQDTGGGDPARLDELTQQVLGKARERPELAGLNTTFRANTVQLRAEVDREKATLLGVPISDVYSAIQAQFGSLTASQYNQFSRVWWVVLQSDPKYRQSPDDLTRLYTRSSGGQMVPLSALVKTSWVKGPDLLPHFNGLPGGEDQRRRGPRLQLGPGHRRRWRRWPGRSCPPATRSRGPASPSRRSSRGARPRPRSPSASSSCSSCWPRSTSRGRCPGAVMTAVPFGILGALAPELAAGPRERRLLPDRPARPDRPRGEERAAARDVRRGPPASRGARSWTPPSRRARCGCGRSS